jgi:hypothetical protein
MERFPRGGDRTMSTKKKLPFGGYTLNFKGVKDSVESVMGSSDIGPAEMTKRLWAFVKSKKLAGK